MYSSTAAGGQKCFDAGKSDRTRESSIFHTLPSYGRLNGPNRKSGQPGASGRRFSGGRRLFPLDGPTSPNRRMTSPRPLLSCTSRIARQLVSPGGALVIDRAATLSQRILHTRSGKKALL